MRSLNRDPDPGWCRVGAITGVHGIKGELKFAKECETDEILQPGAKLHCVAADGARDTVTIRRIRQNGKFYLLSIEGSNDRTHAQSLVGSILYIERSGLPKLEEGAYYWFELMGLSVITVDGVTIGRITEIIATGANDVYVVVQDDGQETLIPAISSIVRSVDLKAAVMRVELPEGL